MTKQKILSAKVVKAGAIRFGVVAIFIGIYMFTDSLATEAAKEKSTAESQLASDKSEINTLSTQLQKSGVAETRFLAIQESRNNLDFSANTDTLKEWLRSAKTFYRLSNNFKLSITGDKVIDNKDLDALNYELLEHPGMKLEFSAISDTHVYSFMDDLMRSAPGLIKIENLYIKRLGMIDVNSVDQMRMGSAPYLVDARIVFNWIGLKEKPPKEIPPASTPPAGGR